MTHDLPTHDLPLASNDNGDRRPTGLLDRAGALALAVTAASVASFATLEATIRAVVS